LIRKLIPHHPISESQYFWFSAHNIARRTDRNSILQVINAALIRANIDFLLGLLIIRFDRAFRHENNLMNVKEQLLCSKTIIL
tara:strand:- start:1975 stop:2223 length:249 start_codon:yes stop_codon:yes gene_type:complete